MPTSESHVTYGVENCEEVERCEIEENLVEDDHTSGMVESGDENDQGQGQVNLCMKITWEKDTYELPVKQFWPALMMEKLDKIIWKTSY